MDRIRKARALGAFAATALLPLAATAGTFAPTPSPVPSQSAAPATPTPGPARGSDAEATQRAREWIARFQSGDIDRSQLTSDFSATLDKTAVAQIQSALPKGQPQSVVINYKDSASGNTAYVFAVTWPEGTLSFTLGITASGKIASAYFRQT
jgi:hypothetical protein